MDNTLKIIALAAAGIGIWYFLSKKQSTTVKGLRGPTIPYYRTGNQPTYRRAPQPERILLPGNIPTYDNRGYVIANNNYQSMDLNKIDFDKVQLL